MQVRKSKKNLLADGSNLLPIRIKHKQQAVNSWQFLGIGTFRNTRIQMHTNLLKN